MREATFAGRLTSDAKRVKNNAVLVQVAVNERVKNKDSGEYEDKANFFGCFAYGKTADYAEKNLKKGDVIAMRSRINSYRVEGEKTTTYNFAVDNIKKLVSASKSVPVESAVTDEPPF